MNLGFQRRFAFGLFFILSAPGVCIQALLRHDGGLLGPAERATLQKVVHAALVFGKRLIFDFLVQSSFLGVDIQGA